MTALPVQPPPKEPGADAALIWGVVAVAGAFFCVLPVVLSPVALVLGRRSLATIRATPGLRGETEAMTGFVLGVIGTVLMALGLLALIAVAVVVVAVSGAADG